MSTFRTAAAALAANGYLPVPIVPYEKRPAMVAWQDYVYALGDELRYTDEGAGLLCGLLRPIDVDVMHAELAAKIRAQAVATWGAMPARIGQAPKIALLCRTLAEGHKLSSLRYRLPGDAPDAKPHCVEILGKGQQLVCFGIHAVTGRPYTHNGAGSPLDVPFEQLPVVTEAELLGFLKWCNALLEEAGGVPLGELKGEASNSTPSAQGLAASNITECVDAIKHIRNDNLSWDDWCRVGLAIKGALGDGGINAWDEFSRKSDKYDYSAATRQWETFHPSSLGAGSLYKWAQDAGWRRPAPPPVDISALLGIKTPASEHGLLLDVAQLREHIGPLRWLVKHTIPQNSVGFIYGPPGSFKSFIALDLALHIAHGLPWLGRKTKAGPVVYVAAEGGAGLLARVDAWHLEHKLDPAAAQFRVCIEPLMLDQVPDLKRLSDAIAALGSNPALIVVDTLSQTMHGDENETQAMAAYLRAIGAGLRARFEATVIAIHHTGHSTAERPRGSSAIIGNSDFLFGIERADGAMTALLSCHKQKDGDKGAPLPFTLVRQVIGTDEDGDELSSLAAVYHDNVAAIIKSSGGPSKYAAVLTDLLYSGPRQHGDLRRAFYVKLSTLEPEARKKAFQRAMRELTEGGKVDQNATDAWLTEAGQT